MCARDQVAWFVVTLGNMRAYVPYAVNGWVWTSCQTCQPLHLHKALNALDVFAPTR